MSFKTSLKFIWSFFVLASFGVYVYWHRFQEPYISPVSAPITAGKDPMQSVRDAIGGFDAITGNSAPAEPPAVVNPPSVPVMMPPQNMPAQQMGMYRNGSYTGNIVDAYYGNMQVKVTISGGKITDVQFLDYPQDRSTSRSISSFAMPMLKAEAIQAQSANVDIVSGATATSGAFRESLGSALASAKN